MLTKEQVRINFYKIQKCGWYKFGANEPDFSSIEDVLTQLQQWTEGVDLSVTKIANPGGKNDEYPVYLFGIQKLRKNWAFATWNEVPSHESGMASIKLDSVVGKPEVHMNELAENSIPGYATYFWVIPERGLIASIRFRHRMTGQTQMSNYVGRFMSAYMSYALVQKNAQGEDIIIGYTDDDNGVPKKVKPMFKTGAYSKPGALDYILQNHARIKKVIRRGHVTSLKKVDRDLWQSVVRFFRSPVREGNNVFVNERVYVELDYQPSLDELRAMIEAEQADPDVGGWDDMGFEMQGEAGKKYWLSHEQATGEFLLEFDRVDEEAIELNSLLATLDANSAEILRILE